MEGNTDAPIPAILVFLINFLLFIFEFFMLKVFYN
jgi:hypothetical protein